MPDQEHDERAREKLKGAIRGLLSVDRDWSRVTPNLRAIAISQMRHELADSITILMGGEGSDR
jgi:hypothetical protein